MSKNSKFATISVAVFVGLFAVYLGGYQNGKSANSSTDTEQATLATPDAPVLAQTADPQFSGEEPSPHLAAIDPEDVDPSSIDWASVANRTGLGVDAMLLQLKVKAEYSPQEIAAYNKLHVVEFNPITQDVCNEVENENYVTGFVTHCSGVRAYPDHPYESMSVDELMDLAEADAAAAVFISKKAETVEERIGFALRAAALSGKPGPLLATAVKDLGTRDSQFGGDTHGQAANGTVPKTVFTRLILESVAQKMGDPRANPDAWRKYIDDFAKSEEERSAVLESIQEGVRSAMEHMAETQRNITGSSQMQELLNSTVGQIVVRPSGGDEKTEEVVSNE